MGKIDKFLLVFLISFFFEFSLLSAPSYHQIKDAGFNFYPWCNVAVSPDGHWVFVSNPDHNDVVKVDLLNFSVQNLHAGAHPATVTISPGGNCVAVINVGTLQFAGDTVTIFPLNSSTEPISTVNLNANFYYYNNVVFTSDNEYAFVASYYNGTLYAFNPWTGEVVNSEYIGFFPSYISISSDNKILAVLYKTNNFLHVKLIDLQQFYTDHQFHTLSDIQTQTIGQDTTNMVFSSDSRYIYLPSYTGNKVTEYLTIDGSISREFLTGSGPVVLSLNSDLNKLYSVDILDNTISIIDLDSSDATRKRYTGVVFDYTNNVSAPEGSTSAWVASRTSNKLLKIDASDGTLLETYTTGNQPNWVSTDPEGIIFASVSELSDRLDIWVDKRQIALPKMDISDDINAGFSFLNPLSSYNSSITIDAYPDNGISSQARKNISLGSLSQFVREWTSSDIDFPVPFNGWLKGITPLLNIKGFTMFYNNSLTYMDGYTLCENPRKNLIIPYVDFNPDKICRIHLTNPSSSTVYIFLKLYSNNNGFPVTQIISIPPMGRKVIDDVGSFFHVDNSTTGFISLSAEKKVYAMVEFGTPDSRAVLAAEPTQGIGHKMILPHFAEGQGWQSSVVFSNPGSSSSYIHAYLYSENGNVLINKNLNILSHKMIVEDVWNLFYGTEHPTELESGWIELIGDTAQLHGAIIFQNDDGKLLSALPAQRVPKKEIYISHVAQNDNYFTGLSLVNSSLNDISKVKIQVMDENGNLVSTVNLSSLGKKEKFVSLLSDPVFAINNQLGGFIHISSDKPLFSYSLFGILHSFLSAIPSQ